MSVMVLLGDLADRGLAWADIARLTGTRTPDVRRWRDGHGAPGPSVQTRLGDLGRLLDHLTALGTDRPVARLDQPLLPGYTVTPGALLANCVPAIHLHAHAHAEGHVTAHDLLDEHSPGWRTAHRREFESYVEDGEAFLRRA